MRTEQNTYSLVRSSKFVTAVGKGPTIETAYTSLHAKYNHNMNSTKLITTKNIHLKPKYWSYKIRPSKVSMDENNIKSQLSFKLRKISHKKYVSNQTWKNEPFLPSAHDTVTKHQMIQEIKDYTNHNREAWKRILLSSACISICHHCWIVHKTDFSWNLGIVHPVFS